ncbi:hypothetical protein SAMD00023353_0601370 [Rosellinia necatrix]|uniref:Uncharacterized protein n=1 Tax=Rosellinia necatrix TaxID=77044 RepID=A0A1S7ULA0_ROSNE|nr:hypothetical protein SAMD00023353_0601370 [Rosellinia necatrix]
MTEQVSGSSLPQARDLGRQQQEEEKEQQQQELQSQSPSQSQPQPQPQPHQQQKQRRDAHLHFRNGDSSDQHTYSHHNHNHNHNHNHQLQHQHQHLHHVRSERNTQHDERDILDDNAGTQTDVVVIVETISVLQVTDSTGSTIIKTLPHGYPATPVVTGSKPVSTIAININKPSTTDLSHADLSNPTSGNSTSDDNNGATDSSSNFSSSSIEDPAATPSGSSMPTSFPTLSYVSITSTPLSAGPVFPSISGLSNSTHSSVFTNSSTSLHSFATASGGNFSVAGVGTGTRPKTTHASASAFTTTVFGTSTSGSPSATHLTETVRPDVTQINGGDGAGGSPAGTDAGAGPVSTSGSASSETSAATIAGSVVGAISGLAVILLLAAVIFKWKKRQTSMKLLQGPGGNDRGHGAMVAGGGGSAGDGGMSERRRSAPFAIPAALANLSGQSRFSKSTVSSDGGERGFAKISGRKLPSVLHFGGDGYTDPRGTMMSDQSIDYRASQSFFGEAPLARLAVGAPMLRESTAPVFHSSVARTAVATPGPFNDPFSDDHALESPTLPPSPVGRFRVSQARSTRSRGSVSRFTEDL